jgi:hypothetical protein
MIRKHKHNIVPGIILLFFAGLAIWWYFWEKPRRDVKNEAAVEIAAADLFKAFSENEQKANGLYLDKVIEVTGKVTEVKNNQSGQQVVVLETTDPIFGVSCTLKTVDPSLQAGAPVTLKGFCSGYLSDVVLRECVNSKPK